MKESKILQHLLGDFLEEVRVQARVEQRRKHVLMALEARFGSAAKKLAPMLEAVTGEERVDRLLDLAIQSATLKEFRDRFEMA